MSAPGVRWIYNIGIVRPPPLSRPERAGIHHVIKLPAHALRVDTQLCEPASSILDSFTPPDIPLCLCAHIGIDVYIFTHTYECVSAYREERG